MKLRFHVCNCSGEDSPAEGDMFHFIIVGVGIIEDINDHVYALRQQ